MSTLLFFYHRISPKIAHSAPWTESKTLIYSCRSLLATIFLPHIVIVSTRIMKPYGAKARLCQRQQQNLVHQRFVLEVLSPSQLCTHIILTTITTSPFATTVSVGLLMARPIPWQQQQSRLHNNSPSFSLYEKERIRDTPSLTIRSELIQEGPG